MSVPVINADGNGSYDPETIRPSLETISSRDEEHSVVSKNGHNLQAINETGKIRDCEFQFPNGEAYSGKLLGIAPEGLGKYVWSDGCTYNGEWRRGIRHGIGKISWPSGSSYDGEFSGGYIHGTGTYVGHDGITYIGRWKLNLKHGLGYQTYPNGDVFEGSWMQGLIEGHGKYIWSNGNTFVGNMKKGKMSGKGTITWKNGDEYEGNWLDGVMHGFGVYTWKNGGCYVGTWTKGLKDGKGTFYPKHTRIPVVQELYIHALRMRGLLPDLKRKNQSSDILVSSSVNMDDKEASKTETSNVDFPVDHMKVDFTGNKHSCDQSETLARRWSLEVTIEKAISHDLLQCSGDSIESTLENHNKLCDSDAPILEREYMQGVLISELVINNKFSSFSPKRAKRHRRRLAKEIQKPGETIIKGHRSYDLMLSLQLGIRYTVGKITPIQRREVHALDFGPRASFSMDFPKAGSQLTPSHYTEDFKWKDYCPMVFRNLREMFKIDAADYMISICGNAALRELSSPGKSGSIFFLSQDDRFMIKTLRKSEVKVLLRMLPNYHHHVQKYVNTLITKFFGLHRVKPPSGQKFRFVVMGNMFCTELRIHRRFDLKGSSLGRSSEKVEIDENTTLKDLDLNYLFYLEPSWREELLKQIEIDSVFLETQCIMDYSLLLGVHFRAPQHLRSRLLDRQSMNPEGLTAVAEDDEAPYPQSLVLVPRQSNANNVVMGPHIRGSRLRASAAGDEEVDLLLPGTARLQIQLAVNMPARAERIPAVQGEDSSQFHEAYDVVLYLGIIDILQEYDMKKKFEHAVKSLQFDSFSISAVDPAFYSSRFLKFIRKVFPENS